MHHTEAISNGYTGANEIYIHLTDLSILPWIDEQINYPVSTKKPCKVSDAYIKY